MNISINNIVARSVSSSYSWDSETPSEASVTSCLLSGDRYIGYAPFVTVELSSYTDNLSGEAIALVTTTDYGDYYNLETSVQTSLISGEQTFCHNYIMPGIYTITHVKTYYTKYDPCYNGEYDTFTTYSEEDTNYGKRPSFSWPWYNFFKEDYDERTELLGTYAARNELITWDDCVFQGPKQVTWDQALGPTLEIRNRPVSWQWKHAKKIPNRYAQYNQSTTWNETRPNTLFPRTWKQIKNYTCVGPNSAACLELVPRLSSTTFTQILTSVIEVKEIPPNAYIEVVHSKPLNERYSPYAVTLSPRFIRSGSFPIEKIVWDLGDGSPLIEKSRNNPNEVYPSSIKFKHSSLFDSDLLDPRNFDIEYSYNRTTNANCFYPSLTAYASSTGTSSCAATIVGPIKYQPYSQSSFKLTQNHLTEKGVCYAGSINGNAAFWNRNK